VVQKALNWTPKLIPVSCCAEPPVVVDRVLRLILPYTERWRGLAPKLRQLVQMWSSTFHELGFELVVSLSFRRGGISLSQALRLQVQPDLHVLQQVRSGR
jgi:hypothetical protein